MIFSWRLPQTIANMDCKVVPARPPTTLLQKAWAVGLTKTPNISDDVKTGMGQVHYKSSDNATARGRLGVDPCGMEHHNKRGTRRDVLSIFKFPLSNFCWECKTIKKSGASIINVGRGFRKRYLGKVRILEKMGGRALVKTNPSNKNVTNKETTW